MLIEEREFPIVRMYFDRADPRGDAFVFQQFEALLARKQNFVFIGFGNQGEHMQSTDERKQVTLWMKRNKQALHSYVTAMVYVEPSPAKRFIAKTFAATFAKYWGYPVITARSEDEARTIAGRLLAGEAPSHIEAE